MNVECGRGDFVCNSRIMPDELLMPPLLSHLRRSGREIDLRDSINPERKIKRHRDSNLIPAYTYTIRCRSPRNACMRALIIRHGAAERGILHTSHELHYRLRLRLSSPQSMH